MYFFFFFQIWPGRISCVHINLINTQPPWTSSNRAHGGECLWGQPAEPTIVCEHAVILRGIVDFIFDFNLLSFDIMLYMQACRITDAFCSVWSCRVFFCFFNATEYIKKKKKQIIRIGHYVMLNADSQSRLLSLYHRFSPAALVFWLIKFERENGARQTFYSQIISLISYCQVIINYWQF